MDKIKVEFYRKLNEYYQERDYLFTKKSFRGHAYSLIDFLLFSNTFFLKFIKLVKMEFQVIISEHEVDTMLN